MEPIMEDEEYDNCLRLIEICKFNYCANNLTQAKKDGLSSLKILNTLLKRYSKSKSINLKDISEKTLELYNNLESETFYSINEKFKWLGSKINNEFYPPIIQIENQIAVTRYKDPDTKIKNLSPMQSKIFKSFESASLIQPNQDWSIDVDKLSTLSQDYLSNCSFVSALLSLSLTDSNIVYNNIYPHQKSTKYAIKFFVNGYTRLIVIDDTLPVLNEHSSAFIKSEHENLLWPAMIEKGYLKIIGTGYDCIGSNFCIDGFMLSGWIPEIINIDNGKVSNWDTIFKFFESKLIILGIGTGNLCSAAEKELNLSSQHDYCIVDMRVVDNDKQLLVQNPWNCNDELRRKWYSETELHWFKSLYINWNPCIFKFTRCINGRFKFNENDDLSNFFNNPQFTIRNTTDEIIDIWILLERHLPPTIEGQTQEILTGLHVFETGGERLLASNGRVIKEGFLSNSRLNLVKFKLNPQKMCTLVVMSSSSCNFTIKGFNNVLDFEIEKSKWLFPCIEKIADDWNFQNSGGNWTNATYIKNPQYNLRILRDETKIQIGLFNDGTNFLNTHLFYSQQSQKKLLKFEENKLILNEKYKSSNQISVLTLKRGIYKLICSTFDKDTSSNYTLLLNSNHPVSITKIPTSLGLFLKTHEFSWNGLMRFKLFFTTFQRGKASFHLSSIVAKNSSYLPSIRASIFKTDGTPVLVNKDFDDCLYGIFIDVELAEGTYVLLVERFEPGDGECLIEIGCDSSVDINNNI